MTCRVEETNTFGRKLHIDIAAEDFNAQLNTKIRELSTTAKVKGFRPGKVPIDVIKRYYGEGIEKEVADTLMVKSYREAIEQHAFKPLAMPSFDDIEINKDKGIHYTAYIEVIPDMQLALDDLTAEKPICEIAEADIDTMLERVRKNHAKWQPTTEAAKIGDRLTVDIRMPTDKGSTPKPLVDQSIVLGSNFLGKNFDDQLENMRANEQREVTMESFAGAENSDSNTDAKKYNVHVKQVEKAILPELDDDFFKACNVKEGGLAALRRLLKEGMEWELDKKVKHMYRENVKNAILEHNDIEIPRSMLKERIESMRERLIQNDADKHSAKQRMPDEIFEENASRQVRLDIIFIYLANKHKLKAERQECNAKISELAADYADADKVINYYNSNADAYQSIQAMVIEDKVIDVLMEKVKPTEKKYSFYEIVGSKDN